jgi:hypothetical protein
MTQRFEPQEYVLGPTQYDRGPPIWRYRKMLTAEDGEVRHLLEMPGHPGNDIVVKDGELKSLAGRNFFAYGNRVYRKHDDLVKPACLCSVGDGMPSSYDQCAAVASRIAEFLECGGDAWSSEFHALSLDKPAAA